MKLIQGFTSLDNRGARPFLETVEAAIREEGIEVRGKIVSPFASVNMYSLGKAWGRGHSALVFNETDEVIGHAMLDCVGGADPSQPWFELRAAWVRKDYRGPGYRETGVHHHVGYQLYKTLLDAHDEKNIFETSITPAAWAVGVRLNMQSIRFPYLPKDVWEKTCSCPKERTGVHPSNNAPDCAIREHGCFLRVPYSTWERMGSPERAGLGSCGNKRDEENDFLVNKNIRVILSQRTRHSFSPLGD